MMSKKDYGRKVASEVFAAGLKIARIAIFDQGYVQIGSKVHKLLGISSDAAISRKSGIGRSVATLATLGTPFPGFNLLSPSQRGYVSLTITTDTDTHIFQSEIPDNSTIKSVQKLVTAGNAVLDAQRQRSNSAALQHQQPIVVQAGDASDLGTQLKSISDLHAQGILTDEEFIAAKAKLLG